MTLASLFIVPIFPCISLGFVHVREYESRLLLKKWRHRSRSTSYLHSAEILRVDNCPNDSYSDKTHFYLGFFLFSLFSVNTAAICSPPYLLFSNTTDIIALDYKTSAAHSIVSGLTRAIAVDVHFSLGYIFWSDVSEHNIKRSATDGSGLTTIITGTGVVNGLAVEWRTSQLYWTDTTYDTISVSDLSGYNKRSLLSLGPDKPRDIAMDPDSG